LQLVDLLRHDAYHHAGKIALRLDGAELTYAQLAARVDATVAALARHVQPGERVGLWLENSFAWVATLLALNALGAVSVPINTRLTVAETRGILRDAQARVVVTTRRYRGRDYHDELMSAAGEDRLALTAIVASDVLRPADWPVTAGAGAAQQCDPVGVDDLLCIQYTSGTTASPKGVLLTNRAYLQTAAHVARCQRLTPSSRFVSGAPFFHCSGTMHAITTCLVAGCTLDTMSAWDPERFLDIVERERCDVSHMIYFRDVLALGAERARPKLATMQVAHDLGTREYLQRIHDELGIPGISNIYGMTETAGQYTMWFPDDPLGRRVAANGRPQPGNHIRIGAPDTGEPMPPGAVGEIQMKGITITPGYFNRPEADADAFTPDGWLRSGDLGTINEDGELHYIARLKELIRVGGENMAPAEVEQALRDAIGVQQVCVLGIPDARLDEVPAAVIVGAPDCDMDAVLGTLRARLAGFKIPRAVYRAQQLPLTATNRVQRAVLREWIVAGKLDRVA
jgi:fatty-acyl-CoA synthase